MLQAARHQAVTVATRLTCQSELQQTVAPSGPSLRPSNNQAHPTNAQVTGLKSSKQSGHWAVSFSKLKQQKPCAHSLFELLHPAELDASGSCIEHASKCSAAAVTFCTRHPAAGLATFPSCKGKHTGSRIHARDHALHESLCVKPSTVMPIVVTTGNGTAGPGAVYAQPHESASSQTHSTRLS